VGRGEAQTISGQRLYWFKKNIFEPKHVPYVGRRPAGQYNVPQWEVTSAIDWDMTHIGAAEDDLAGCSL